MEEAKPTRYLAIIQFRADTSTSDLSRRVPALQAMFSRFSKGEMEQCFRSSEGHLFGVLFKAALPSEIINAELNKRTVNGDTFLVFEAGNLTVAKAFGRAATWLQRH